MVTHAWRTVTLLQGAMPGRPAYTAAAAAAVHCLQLCQQPVQQTTCYSSFGRTADAQNSQLQPATSRPTGRGQFSRLGFSPIWEPHTAANSKCASQQNRGCCMAQQVKSSQGQPCEVPQRSGSLQGAETRGQVCLCCWRVGSTAVRRPARPGGGSKSLVWMHAGVSHNQ